MLSSLAMLNPSRFGTVSLLALLMGAVGACEYDLQKLEEAAKAREDAGPQIPEQLIDLFEDAPFFDDACRKCAVDNCRGANEACHDDPECEAVTACLARVNTPRTHAECRAEHIEWFEEHMQDIDVGGPFYDCVFWRSCQSQCGASEDLSCLGEYSWGSTATGAQVPVSLLLQEALTLEQATGVTAKVCRIEDFACDDPSFSDESDDRGKVDLMLPAPLGDFTGYVEITGGGLAPTLLVFGWPVTTADARRIPIVSADTLQLQRSFGGVAAVEGTGMIQARVYGCGGSGLRGVSVEVRPSEESTRTWYFDGQLPTFDVDATFDNGNAGVINVPAGAVEVVGKDAKSGDVVTRWTVPVRADHLTILLTAPKAR